jgi:hypothetical protein
VGLAAISSERKNWLSRPSQARYLGKMIFSYTI